MAAFRRPKNLRDSLVHANIEKTHICGSRPCNIRRCLTCKLITTTSQFTSTVTGKTYNILHNLSCDSHTIIHLITCTKCKKQYVGLTSQTLRKRFNTHRSNINNQRGDAVGLHFNLPEHDIGHLQVTPIDQLKNTDMIGLKKKEIFWIKTLQTVTPQGIDLDGRTCFPISRSAP
ncbi:hypothetical protein ElyMa_002869000 [Elysia marginata]|uniref:GIY-YIG domain-containing protein n=1 Tax=Elysia marginata TaxID=1093978 RepID=A0AAV4HXE4_9GAST|nr:hypothetical protein ElyMa_002869000 [Elysia marginata]